jgi:murein DD-endopeptidase MepM/ murein hydrolase activator NlpD
MAWRNRVFSEAANPAQENRVLNQPYFIVVLAHSLHGRLRRVHVPYQFVYVVLGLALLGTISLAGLVTSYARMALKVANYNDLREEVQTLRTRYQHLENDSRQKGVQLASLQLLANEVSVAFGIKRTLEGPVEIAHEGRLVPTLRESLEEYNFLKSANLSRVSRRANPLFHSNMLPNVWPVDGRLMSNFGNRTDPFSGGGAWHAGVDISAPSGTAVKASADGVVAGAEWAGAYGRLVVLDHGSGIQTYYAHLSRMDVVAGQWVRRGSVVGRVGATGRVTSAHLHYEVRRGGTPINPAPYLKATLAQSRVKKDLLF